MVPAFLGLWGTPFKCCWHRTPTESDCQVWWGLSQEPPNYTALIKYWLRQAKLFNAVYGWALLPEKPSCNKNAGQNIWNIGLTELYIPKNGIAQGARTTATGLSHELVLPGGKGTHSSVFIAYGLLLQHTHSTGVGLFCTKQRPSKGRVLN